MAELTLPEAAFFLRKLDPQRWEDFVNSFERYSDQVTVAVTEASPEEVLIYQGMARQCRALVRCFRECHLQKQKPPPSTRAP